MWLCSMYEALGSISSTLETEREKKTERLRHTDRDRQGDTETEVTPF